MNILLLTRYMLFRGKASSVQFSRSVVTDSLWPHGLQHTRPLCPLQTPGVYSNSCPLSQWCHPTISSSVIPFSCLQSFPASVAFQMSQFFASGSQRIGVSASASVLLMNIQGWFPLGWIDWISLLSKGLSRVLQNHSSKASVLQYSSFFMVYLSCPYLSTRKTYVKLILFINNDSQETLGSLRCLNKYSESIWNWWSLWKSKD